MGVHGCLMNARPLSTMSRRFKFIFTPTFLPMNGSDVCIILYAEAHKCVSTSQASE